MYFYSVGCHTYEESPEVVLYHLNYFTKEEFDGFIFPILKELIDTAREGIELYEGQLSLPVHFESLFHEVADRLCSRHGFQKIKKEVVFQPHGWTDLLKLSDPSSTEELVGEDDYNSFVEYLKKEQNKFENKSCQSGS